MCLMKNWFCIIKTHYQDRNTHKKIKVFSKVIFWMFIYFQRHRKTTRFITFNGKHWETHNTTFLDIYKSFDIAYTEKGEICELWWYSIYNSKTISYSVQYWHEKHLSSFSNRIRHTFIYIDIFEKYNLHVIYRLSLDYIL